MDFDWEVRKAEVNYKKHRLLVVAYTYREAKIRIILVRLAEPRERTQYEAAR